MYKTRKHFKVTSSETNGIYWRRVELTDLPKLKKMMNKESSELFGVFNIAQIITDNPLSLCQVNPNGKITIFMSLSDRPNVSCISSDNWIEWFNYFYDLKNVKLNNTLFINVLLFRCVDSLIYLPVLLEMVYVQIPEIKNIILIKPPRTKICAKMCLPFSTLSTKNVSIDLEFGCPEILYHIRAFSINKINLRIAEYASLSFNKHKVDDFIDLRAYLGHRLDFLDNFYGEYSLAKILEFPGEDRINLVPDVKVNGLMTVYTNLDYPFLDSVFDLYQYSGLIELKDEKKKANEPKSILRLATDLSRMMEKTNNSNILSEIATNVQYEFISNQFKQLTDKISKPMKQFFQSNILQKDSDSLSIEQKSLLKLSNSLNNSRSEKNVTFFKEIHNTENKNIIKDFLKFQDKESKKANDMSYYISNSYYSSENTTYTKTDYRRTAFMIELMLIDIDEENKATWDYLNSIFIYFTEFPQYEYCLINLHTIAAPPELKKFFCNAILKPNRTYPMGLLYIMHRSFLTGSFSCVLVTKEHLELMELMIENHPFKHIISNNISKSVFEDTRYKTYIFQCNDQPIGYCVIRLNDEIKFLSSYFDVARYAYPKLARNHMAVLLNMDVQRTFIKKTRGLLKLVMEDSDINCLFYKLYTDLTIMEECELSYITEIKELIPVKPRIRIQYDNENVFGDHEKFALFHINTRLYSTQTMSIDAKIVVVGASVVALSFLESLLFNPFSYYIRFGNIVLISDCGTPYQLTLTNFEDRMIPKIAHFNYEYMVSMGFKSFVDVIIGTVTAINKADKCVTVNEDEQVYYDYLFLFYGEQFGYTAEENETKPQNSIESSDETNILENLFLLNSEHDVTHAYKYIESIKNNEKDIIVFGKYLGSLTVINVLLESNIDGPRIVYVETHAKENIPFIANKFIRNAVYNELYSQGVRVYKKCVFRKFTLNGDRTRIRKVTFTAAGDILFTLDCAALFWFDQKFTSKVNWFTMLQSALKFDGHLVVNTSFETNIEFVYAAGPMARFMHNEYFVVSHHMYYSRLEIGARVANVLMKRLGIVDDDKSNDEYVRPLFVYCQLPGKYNYFHAEVPVLRSLKSNARTLSTGNVTDGYFEILVDSNGDVLALSCYSNKDIKYLNLINLCGKHVNLFNDMMYRFKMDSIPCFFEYFNQSWSYPLYSDRFWKMLDETKLKRDNKIIKKFLCRDDIATLMSKLKVNTISRLSRSPYLDNRFDQLCGKKLNTILMNFIANNVDDFPMFSHTVDQRETEDEYNTI